MERLVRLAVVLHRAGPEGVPAETLITVAGFAGRADPGSQLAREIRHLREVGWQIDNIAPHGEDARYRMTSIDSQLQIKLTASQQSALRRAALLADRGDLGDRLGLPQGATAAEAATAPAAPVDEATLETVLRAVRQRCLLRFRYKGTPRRVHPGSVRAANQAWHLHGRENGDDRLKVFVVGRMSEVSAGEPGSARRPSVTNHPSLHPMHWEYDDPVEVSLAAAQAYAPDVRRWLGEAVSERVHDGEVVFVYRVTNRAGLRARLYQLGTRVRVLGPEEIRFEMLGELAAMAGE
jgi:predicted DNA-binding transcriptional regulator YafY